MARKKAKKRPAKRPVKRARANPTYQKVRTVRLSPYRKGMGPTFTLELYDLNQSDSAGRFAVGYKLTEKRPGQKRSRVLFECKDPVCAVFVHSAVDSDETVENVLTWLTLRPGDTDAEWFESYSRDQLDFANSDAEALQVETMDRFGTRENPAPPRRVKAARRTAAKGARQLSGMYGDPRVNRARADFYAAEGELQADARENPWIGPAHRGHKPSRRAAGPGLPPPPPSMRANPMLPAPPGVRRNPGPMRSYEENTRISEGGVQLFGQALARVESESIREWASSPYNMPIWLEAARRAVESGNTDPDHFAAMIVSQAMGL